MKLILIINDNIQKEYKTLKAIHKDYPDYDYHQLRQIYLQSTGQEIRKMHPRNKELFKTIRIIDKPRSSIIASNNLELLLCS
jgi:ribosomal 50S subunit-associated protein YjgA (DUF615 family)